MKFKESVMLCLYRSLVVVLTLAVIANTVGHVQAEDPDRPTRNPAKPVAFYRIDKNKVVQENDWYTFQNLNVNVKVKTSIVEALLKEVGAKSVDDVEGYYFAVYAAKAVNAGKVIGTAGKTKPIAEVHNLKDVDLIDKKEYLKRQKENKDAMLDALFGNPKKP
jgi:predicted DNA-binding protein